MSQRASLVMALCVAAACGGAEPAAPAFEIPARSATSGDRLLALAPLGADAVLELDLGRLRSNGVVGTLVRAVLPAAGELAGVSGVIGAVDQVVVLSYGLGDGAARTLVLCRGGDAEKLVGAARLGGGAVAIGEAALVRRALAVAGGHEPPLTSDRELLALRALAMPEGAAAATVRLTARLGFEARLALARRLELDAVPRTISVWGDVVDDLAVIALLGAERLGDTRELEREGSQLVARLAGTAPVFGRALARELGRTRVEASGALVRFTLVIGPRRLATLVGRAVDALEVAARAVGPEGT